MSKTAQEAAENLQNQETGNDVQGNDTAATEANAEHAIEAASTATAVAPVATGGAYITGLLNSIKEDFVQANEGLDMDFVYMGSWLVINKKGNFIEKDDESVSYGDKIDVVIGSGEKRWSLWGLEKSPEDGKLIVACKEKEEAMIMLEAWLDENPDARSRYSINDLELRYMAYVVPVASLGPDNFPKIYLMSFSPTGTISYGKYAMKVYQGGFKLQGVAPRTGINRVVTRISTSEKQGKGTNSFIGVDFEAVGMFNPAEYGIEEA